MTSRSIALMASCLLLTSAHAALAQGSATNVAVAPRTVAEGGTVSVTVTGTNPCGAVRINYGDGGDAITYAISALPVTQSHLYPRAGTYTLTAEGMGNCGGTPTTTLAVSAPPPPVPPPSPATPTITSVEIAPTPARIQEPVPVVARGTGRCAYEVRYGDGTAEQVDARLPEDTHHTYARTGRYVRDRQPEGALRRQVYPGAPGRRRSRAAGANGAADYRMSARPTPAASRQPVTLTIDGSGVCTFTIDYGDGNTDSRSMTPSASLRHAYSARGS